jgi:hypothetical protein
LIPIIVLHIYYYRKASEKGTDFAFAITAAIVCEQIEFSYSLISATLPNLKAFIESFNTSFMMDIGHKVDRSGHENISEGSPASSSHGAPQIPTQLSYVEEHPLHPITPTTSFRPRSAPRARSSKSSPSSSSSRHPPRHNKTSESTQEFIFFPAKPGVVDHFTFNDHNGSVLEPSQEDAPTIRSRNGRARIHDAEMGYLVAH